jgi:hypothetical protein
MDACTGRKNFREKSEAVAAEADKIHWFTVRVYMPSLIYQKWQIYTRPRSLSRTILRSLFPFFQIVDEATPRNRLLLWFVLDMMWLTLHGCKSQQYPSTSFESVWSEPTIEWYAALNNLRYRASGRYEIWVLYMGAWSEDRKQGQYNCCLFQLPLL